MQVKSKADAQRRADQIGFFQAELKAIEQENILSLNESQRSAIANYHENLIDQMSSAFDIANLKHKVKHLLYTGGWKKFETIWNLIINLGRLNNMLPLLEILLSEVKHDNNYLDTTNAKEQTLKTKVFKLKKTT